MWPPGIWGGSCAGTARIGGGVGSYHSLTPQHNRRYQVLVYNEMVRAGALPGPVKPVPARQP